MMEEGVFGELPRRTQPDVVGGRLFSAEIVHQFDVTALDPDGRAA